VRGPASLALLAYVLLTFALHPKLRFAAFNRIGDYSYGLYVYAFPIQQALVHVQRDLGPIALFAAAFALTLLVAIASWHGMEKPALGLKSRFTTRLQPA
jgi:peptidoglycan/LPS O-acetylase OafA/YrhL